MTKDKGKVPVAVVSDPGKETPVTETKPRKTELTGGTTRTDY